VLELFLGKIYPAHKALCAGLAVSGLVLHSLAGQRRI